MVKNTGAVVTSEASQSEQIPKIIITGSLSERRQFYNVFQKRTNVAACNCASGQIDALRADHGDGNENVKKAIRLTGKTTTLDVHQAFFVHDFFAVTAPLRRKNV